MLFAQIGIIHHNHTKSPSLFCGLHISKIKAPYKPYLCGVVY